MSDNFKQSQNLQGWSEISRTDLLKEVNSWFEGCDEPVTKRFQQSLQDALTDLDKIYWHDPDSVDHIMSNTLTDTVDLDMALGLQGWSDVLSFAEPDGCYHSISVLKDYPETLDYRYINLALGGSPMGTAAPYFIKAKAS